MFAPEAHTPCCQDPASPAPVLGTPPGGGGTPYLQHLLNAPEPGHAVLLEHLRGALSHQQGQQTQALKPAREAASDSPQRQPRPREPSHHAGARGGQSRCPFQTLSAFRLPKCLEGSGEMRAAKTLGTEVVPGRTSWGRGRRGSPHGNLREEGNPPPSRQEVS